ncbi:hypothetical protein [Lysobacter sp. Root690]|uniref:hypothetical protein n=1 Tax=Lysobacter sp. Root690 TaxID=1736588 RepID=UPI0012F7E417|nr:hypothetical protein [Lysobacter sp. Root690]
MIELRGHAGIGVCAARVGAQRRRTVQATAKTKNRRFGATVFWILCFVPTSSGANSPEIGWWAVQGSNL